MCICWTINNFNIIKVHGANHEDLLNYFRLIRPLNNAIPYRARRLICLISCDITGVCIIQYSTQISGVPSGGSNSPPPEIPKALQNRAKLNPICENC